MKVTAIIHKDKINSAGLAPVSLLLSRKSQRVKVPSGITAPPDKWNGNGIVEGDVKTTGRIFAKIAEAEKVIARLEYIGKLKNMTIKQIKAEVAAELNGEPLSAQNGFLAYFRRFAETKTGRTKEIYLATIHAIEKNDNKADSRAFEDIDVKYLTKLQNALTNGRESLNGASIHLRNIRAVFNSAIDDEITSFYPFRKFKIKSSPTKKKNLTAEGLRSLWEHPCEPHQQRYLDFFKLSFLLIGANPIDICENGKINNGRFEYIRAKTHKPYSIKIEPETAELLNKYRGKKKLLSFAENFTSYKTFSGLCNKELKLLGGAYKIPNAKYTKGRYRNLTRYAETMPELTIYHARHTWASIAAELDIPKETIAAALGHSSRSVTDIYIDFDTRKIDEANRRVIDFALYGKK